MPSETEQASGSASDAPPKTAHAETGNDGVPRASARGQPGQALHWLAFLGAINLLWLDGVQSMLPGQASGQSVLTLLALGTFVAGVHLQAWQVWLLGAIMCERSGDRLDRTLVAVPCSSQSLPLLRLA